MAVPSRFFRVCSLVSRFLVIWVFSCLHRLLLELCTFQLLLIFPTCQAAVVNGWIFGVPKGHLSWIHCCCNHQVGTICWRNWNGRECSCKFSVTHETDLSFAPLYSCRFCDLHTENRQFRETGKACTPKYKLLWQSYLLKYKLSVRQSSWVQIKIQQALVLLTIGYVSMFNGKLQVWLYRIWWPLYITHRLFVSFKNL